jgi:hypothetical protein
MRSVTSPGVHHSTQLAPSLVGRPQLAPGGLVDKGTKGKRGRARRRPASLVEPALIFRAVTRTDP